MKWTIRRKFLLGYFLLFTVTAFLVQQIVKDSLEANSHVQIERDMTKLQHTTREYTKQFSLIHPTEENLFTVHGTDIAQELSKLHQQSVALYDESGNFIYESIPTKELLLAENQVYQSNRQEADYPELNAAYENQASYTRQNVERGTLIYFAYPVYIQGEFMGVFRFTGDYTDLFARNDTILTSFTILIVFLFIGVFLISFVITTQITKPLIRLTKGTKQVAIGNYQGMVHVNSKDELGVLAESFNDMQRKVKLHIDEVEAEKDKVLLLEKTRTSFFNNVTHELKTPLATISGYAQIIGEPDFDDAEFLQKATKKIRSESERLNRMVIELIELSKSETKGILKERAPVNLYALVLSICEDMYVKAKKRQQTIEITGSDCIVLGNQDELRQILINVLDNAIKYGIPNTPISVTLFESTITLENSSNPIPTQIESQIFEPFIHTKGIGSSGLGLTIVKQLVTQHNGTISFDYDEGTARVSIVFPHWQ